MFDPTNALNAYGGLELPYVVALILMAIIITIGLSVWLFGRVRIKKTDIEANTEKAVTSVLTQLTGLLQQSQQQSAGFLTTLEKVTSSHETELRAREQSFQSIAAHMETIGDSLAGLKNNTMTSVLMTEETAERIKSHTIAIETLKDVVTGLGTIATTEHEKTRQVTAATMHGELIPLYEQIRMFEQTLRTTIDLMNTTAYEHLLDNILVKVTRIETRLFDEILKPPENVIDIATIEPPTPTA